MWSLNKFYFAYLSCWSSFNAVLLSQLFLESLHLDSHFVPGVFLVSLFFVLCELRCVNFLSIAFLPYFVVSLPVNLLARFFLLTVRKPFSLWVVAFSLCKSSSMWISFYRVSVSFTFRIPLCFTYSKFTSKFL